MTGGYAQPIECMGYDQRGDKYGMETKLARFLVGTAMRSVSDLISAIPVVERFCTPEELEEIRSAIGTISAEISTSLINSLLREHPDLSSEIEEEIVKYGRML
jgi:hypothetical protein